MVDVKMGVHLECTITAFAALASIIPLGRKSEKVPEGMRRSGVANTVIVHPIEHRAQGPDFAREQIARAAGPAARFTQQAP